jgi:hypothetical protein
MESETCQEDHRYSSHPWKPSSQPGCSLVGLDGVRSQGVEAHDATPAVEDIGYRSPGPLIRQSELLEPLIKGEDSAVEISEMFGGLQPPNRPQIAQLCGMRLDRENKSTS